MTELTEKEKKSLEEQIKKAGEKVIQAEKDKQPLEHYIRHAYHTYVDEQKIHQNEFKFNDKQKEELIDKIVGNLKEHLYHIGKFDKKKVAGISDEAWEEAILPSYFGISKSALMEIWADKEKITEDEITGVFKSAHRSLEKTLYKSALTPIIDKHLKPGVPYLNTFIKDNELGIKLKKSDIKTYDHLREVIKQVYKTKHLKDEQENNE